MEYVAFLLGINVGKRTIKMADLKRLMETLGYERVRTILASGNVIFEAGSVKPDTIGKKMEVALENEFGFKVGVIVRPTGEVERMLKAKPFKNIVVTPSVRRYVTFLSEKPASLAVPASPSHAYRVLKVAVGEVYSVLDLSKAATTPDVMKLLGTAYGKKITTRNWNTIEKIARG